MYGSGHMYLPFFDTMKAVIIVAWLGTRMLPITKTVPKELLPVGNKPVIQYIVEDLVQAGIDDIIMVTSAHKTALEAYFSDAPYLENLLASHGKTELLDLINKPKTMARYTFVRQEEQLGTAHALMQAKHLLDDGEPFIVVFGDMVFPPMMYEGMITTHKKTWWVVMAANHVPREEVYKYGVMALDGDRITSIVEKPSVEDAPSTLIWNGVVLLNQDVFPYMDTVIANRQEGREAYLPEAIWLMLDTHPVYVHEVAPFWDIGNPDALLKANAYLYEHGKLF
jgi:UTP--glucose-1-phosphate uridylyltransferase